jgi:group I intron endonuclease
MTGIYKITNPNGKVYIGQTTRYEKRKNQYLKLRCENQIKIYRSLKKYGPESHVFEFIEACDREVLNERERHYQDLYNSLDNGLNCVLTKASGKPKVLSLETRQKMRESNLGKIPSAETRLKMSESRKGKTPTLETRKKQSEKMKGVVFTEEHKRKISVGKTGQRISDDQKAFLRKIMKDRHNEKGMPKNMMIKGMKHTDENKRKMAERPCNHPNRRMVINMETGIFYDSAGSAGASVGVKHPTVMYRIKKGIGSFSFV